MRFSRKGRGFALIISLIMIALAAIIAVTLLTNSSLERLTAVAYGHRYSAELAAQNGLEAAKKALNASPTAANSVTQDDTFLVLRVDGTQTNSTSGFKDAYYYIAKPQPGTANQIDCYPLFSGGTNATITTNLASSPIGSLPTPASGPFSTNPAEETFGSNTKRYPQVYTFQQIPYTQWQEIKDPNDTAAGTSHDLPYQRYTFWVEDLAGYVDASVAGNIADPGTKNKRPLDQSTPQKRYLSNPSEVALFTIFDGTPPTDPGNTKAKDLIDNRPVLFTVPTLRQIAPGPGNTDITSPYLAARLRADLEQPIVPFGFGYKDEGSQSKLKIDLNKEIQTGGSGAVQNIATKITDNLPNFSAQRRGGLPTTVLDYNKTLAASMIDYADTNTDATVGSDYRGIDAYPFVNELYTMKWWRRTYLNGTYFVEVQLETWVELWNPSNQNVTGTIQLEMLEHHPIQAGSYTYTFGIKNGEPANGSSVSTTYPAGQTISVNMQPNEYAAYHLRSDTFQLNTGVSPPLIFPAAGVNSMPLSGSLNSNYQLTWTGSGGTPQIVDKAGGGIQRISGTLRGPPNYINSQKNWRGSYPGFGYTNNAANSIPTSNTLGDPRAAFYEGSGTTQYGQSAIVYDQGSSFWGRNSRSNIVSAQVYAAARPQDWPDRGHNTQAVGAPPSSAVADPPTSRPGTIAIEPSKAPGTLSKSGSYVSLAELGNVHDACQWQIAVDNSTSPPRWTDIASSDPADVTFGGGMTLRIGRPEFTKFDQPGLRAWQLLDLFNIGQNINTSGLININTASRDTLRALGANILLNRDPDLTFASGSAPLYPPYNSKQADLFADAVIAGRPFLSKSQLAMINNSAGSKFFGNSSTWPTSGAVPKDWTDAGTEELFAKILSLTTVRSRNFRVFVTGQSLDKSGKVLSTVHRVYHVFLNPTRDSSGKVTSQNAITTYEAQVPL